jgi:hypothetical protein
MTRLEVFLKLIERILTLMTNWGKPLIQFAQHLYSILLPRCRAAWQACVAHSAMQQPYSATDVSLTALKAVFFGMLFIQMIVSMVLLVPTFAYAYSNTASSIHPLKHALMPLLGVVAMAFYARGAKSSLYILKQCLADCAKAWKSMTRFSRWLALFLFIGLIGFAILTLYFSSILQ